MLYLLVSSYIVREEGTLNFTPKLCMKIGYTANLESRMKCYINSSLPVPHLIDSREGTQRLEGLFHLHYKDKLLNLPNTREWMEYDEKIIEEFKNLTMLDLIDSMLKNNREHTRVLKRLILNYFCNDISTEEEQHHVEELLLNSTFDKYCKDGYLTQEDMMELFEIGRSIFGRGESEDFKIFLGIQSFSKELEDRIFLHIDVDEITLTLSPEEQLEKERELERMKVSYENAGQIGLVKMREVCKVLLSPKWKDRILISDLDWLERSHRYYLVKLGPSGLKSLGCNPTNSSKRLEDSSILKTDKFLSTIYSTFIVGKKYTSVYVKDTLLKIYSEFGISKKAKGTDLIEYFIIKPVTVKVPETGKFVAGYQILAIK